jgi:CheY-like chemotaxis protein
MRSKICFLIDDDDDDREILETVLYRIHKDICCITAINGAQALLHLSRYKYFIPDYIFIDLHMPRMDGKQCLAEIKKQRRLKNTPVIMYSTSTAAEDIEETRKLGAAAYIRKQYNLDRLERSLKEFFADYPKNLKGYEY